MREEIRIEGFPEPISHYVDAVRFGNLVFISGLAGFDANLKMSVGDDVVAQAQRIFVAMKTVLDRVGASFADVLRVNVYLTDVEDRAKINVVRQEYFGKSKPASTLIGVKALAFPEMKIEIDAVVGLPKQKSS